MRYLTCIGRFSNTRPEPLSSLEDLRSDDWDEISRGQISGAACQESSNVWTVVRCGHYAS